MMKLESDDEKKVKKDISPIVTLLTPRLKN